MDENYGYDDPEFELPDHMSGVLRRELEPVRNTHMVVVRGTRGYCYACDREVHVTQDGECPREGRGRRG